MPAMAEENKTDISGDPNFKRIVAAATSLEEFNSLIASNLAGYSQKKRVVEAMKPFLADFEEINRKVQIRASIGAKGKDMVTAVELAHYNDHGLADIKEKMRILNNEIQAALEEGRVPSHERKAVLEDLRARLAAAEEAGKAKVKEKLEAAIASVEGAERYELPFSDVLELDSVRKQLRAIRALEKQDWYKLTEVEQKKLERKWDLTASQEEIESRNRMWFETDSEFQVRMKLALEGVLDIKIEQKRQAALARPKKEVKPQPKKADKKNWNRVDPRDLFDQPGEEDVEHTEVSTTADEPQADPTPSPCESPKLAPAPAPDATSQPQEEAAQEAAAPAPVASSPEDGDVGKDPALAAARLRPEKPKKEKGPPAPAPKKKEKAKFKKVDPSLIAFELA